MCPPGPRGPGHRPRPHPHRRRRCPAWPDGVVGSMTHCDGYRAAAVAHAGEVLGVGIDAEHHLPLPEGVFASIALPRHPLGSSAVLCEGVRLQGFTTARSPPASWSTILRYPATGSRGGGRSARGGGTAPRGGDT
ncbi:hypothetical protein [Streptomyces sviceus]|uniref:hypothetical protein n=1 Tax=Streptomyces sviceus TaxID=285530 RepID=UPI0036F07E48